MRKIDRLGWATGLCFDAYGVRVGIRVNKPELLEGIRSVLPPGGREIPRVFVDRLYSLLMGSNGTQSRVRRFHLVYAGVGRLARTMDLEEARPGGPTGPVVQGEAWRGRAGGGCAPGTG